jgi:TATA-box binding protein (TBP) (component of TFIID and TFIIIB)
MSRSAPPAARLQAAGEKAGMLVPSSPVIAQSAGQRSYMVGFESKFARQSVPELKCANVVATSDVKCRFDLAKVARRLQHSTYDPEGYHALIYRPHDTGVSIFLNTSGKVVFAGARSVNTCRTALVEFVADLDASGFDARTSPVKVQNMVFSGKFDKTIELSKLAPSRAFSVKYAPRRFPGAVLRSRDNPSHAVLLFRAGSMVVLGCKRQGDAIRLAKAIEDELKRASLM